MVKSKTITLKVYDYDFPELFNLEQNALEYICYNLFEIGYNRKYPKYDLVDHQTDSIKLELGNIERKFNELDMTENINKFSFILEELLGITNNSYKKGKMAEDAVFEHIKHKFPEYSIDETRGIPHSGDGLIHVSNDIKIMVEIKNYIKSVSSDEIDKLKYDMTYTNTKYAIMISLKTNFVGKGSLEIEEFNYDSSTYYILYVSLIMENYYKIDYSIAMFVQVIKHIMTYNQDNLHNFDKRLNDKVSSHMGTIDSIYNDYLVVKNKYEKIENNIKSSLCEFYRELRNYEITMKNKINTVWTLINDDIDKSKVELLVTTKSNKIIEEFGKKKTTDFKIMFDVCLGISKKGYTIDDMTKNMWSVNYNGTMIGNIIKKTGNIQIIIVKPELELNIPTTSTKINQYLNIIEEAFRC